MASSEQSTVICEVCELSFSSFAPFEQHIKGKRHKKQVEEKKQKMQVKTLDEQDSFPEEMKESDTQGYVCESCEMELTAMFPYTQHMKSKPHSKVLRRKNAEDDPAQLENVGNDSELPDNDADVTDPPKKILHGPIGSCSLCEKQFNSAELYSQHMKSKSHAKREFELQLVKKIKTIFASTGEVSDSEEACEDDKREKVVAGSGELKCKLCKKMFTGTVSYAQHFTTKGHLKRVRQENLLNELMAVKVELEDGSSLSEDEESSAALSCEFCSAKFCGPDNLKAHIEGKKHQKAMRLKQLLMKKGDSMENGGKTHTGLEDNKDTKKPCTEKETDSQAKTESTKEAEKVDESVIEV